MRSDLCPERVSAGLTIIERNAVRLRELVEDLLTLSAYDAEAVRLDRQPVSLDELVAESQQSLTSLASEKGVDLRLVSARGLPPVLADRAHLERVVDNLLGNAVKFTRAGGQVTVRVTSEDDQVVLAVTDTGIGIPAEEQDQLFARFFRSSLSVRDEIQGVGLGLALVRTVVEWHGGTVQVDSVEAEGTTVTVRLPRADPAASL